MVELSLVEFPADDPERARRFWEGLLGVPFAEREDGEGSGWQTRKGGVALGLHERGPGPGDRFSLPYFAVADVGGRSRKPRRSPASSSGRSPALAQHGIEPRRLMSDNAWSYTLNSSLRELLTRRGIRHLTTKPHRPRTNGKVERFIQTLEREWAYGLTYASSEHRRRALPHWLDHYNTRRPHSSLGDQSPISRVQNVCRQDS